MYIQSVNLQNVKCFSQVTLALSSKQQTGDLQSNWNVILGHNGDGKTTLLQAIAACLMDATTVDRLLKPSRWVRGKEQFATLSATISACLDDRVVGKMPDEPVAMFYVLANGGSELPVFDPIKGERDTRYFPTTTVVDPSLLRVLIPEALLPGLPSDMQFMRRNAYASRENAGWVSCGYGAFRRVQGFASETVTISEPLQRRFLTLFEEGAALYDCEAWLKELDRRAAKSDTGSSARGTLAGVKRALLKLLPDVEEIEINNEVVFRWRSGEVGLGQLSDGYRAMFALAADLLRWLEMLHPLDVPLEECSGVVLIDEIDTHLHPSWQRKAGFLLTEVFPNLQFIVTSHSPFVAMAAGEGALTLLEKDGDTVTARQDVPYVRGWAVDQVLTELFGLVSLRDPRTQQELDEYESLRNRLRTTTLSILEQQQLANLERSLNERLRGQPQSPEVREFNEDLAFFRAQAMAKQEVG